MNRQAYPYNNQLNTEPRGVDYDLGHNEFQEGIATLSNQMMAYNAQSNYGFTQILNKVEAIGRKEKKKRIGETMATAVNGDIVVLTHYDDSSQTSKNFILNAKGPVNVYRIMILETETAEKFGIQFGTSTTWIVGEVSKVSPNYLYQKFIKAGVHFNSDFGCKDIGKILFEAFAAAIEQTDVSLTVPCSGGWNDGTYLDSTNFPFMKIREFDSYPVMKKKIIRRQLTDEDVDAYVAELHKIRSKSARLLLAIYPFASIIASILKDSNHPLQVVLNIVPYERIPLKRIMNLIQGSNRDKLLPIATDSRFNVLEEKCVSCRDEALILDFRDSLTDNPYDKKKKAKSQLKIVDAFQGYTGLNSPILPMGLVTISNSAYPGKGICNVLLGKNEYAYDKSELSEDVMTAIISEFISYVSENFSDILSIIKKERKIADADALVLRIIFDILTFFWRHKGYSIRRILGFDLVQIDFTKLLKENYFELDELLSAFIKAVRIEGKSLIFLEKTERRNCDDAIRYDDSWLWIPTHIMKMICRNRGLEKYLPHLLIQMKSEDILKTDTDGMTRKLQTTGERREFYQIKRNVFTKTGEIDLVYIGKELEQ